MFTTEERKSMIERVIAEQGYQNVTVEVFGGWAVDGAKNNNACAIIRGLRLTADFEFELNYAFNTRKLDPNIEVVWIPPQQEHLHISSTVARQYAKGQRYDALAEYVPELVLKALRKKTAPEPQPRWP